VNLVGTNPAAGHRSRSGDTAIHTAACVDRVSAGTPSAPTKTYSDIATRSRRVRYRFATWRGNAPTVSWLFDKIAQLASARRLFVVVDGIESDDTPSGEGTDWGSLLGGLGQLLDTTAVSIARVSDKLVDVVIRQEAGTYHCLATSSEAQVLLQKMQARLSPATLYVGDGTHASTLERNVGYRDLSLTTWRPCAHDRAISFADLDNARPIVEMLYVLRRGTESQAGATSENRRRTMSATAPFGETSQWPVQC
jgi:hypothetical protein